MSKHDGRGLRRTKVTTDGLDVSLTADSKHGPGVTEESKLAQVVSVPFRRSALRKPDQVVHRVPIDFTKCPTFNELGRMAELALDEAIIPPDVHGSSLMPFYWDVLIGHAYVTPNNYRRIVELLGVIEEFPQPIEAMRAKRFKDRVADREAMKVESGEQPWQVEDPMRYHKAQARLMARFDRDLINFYQRDLLVAMVEPLFIKMEQPMDTVQYLSELGVTVKTILAKIASFAGAEGNYARWFRVELTTLTRHVEQSDYSSASEKWNSLKEQLSNGFHRVNVLERATRLQQLIAAKYRQAKNIYFDSLDTKYDEESNAQKLETACTQLEKELKAKKEVDVKTYQSLREQLAVVKSYSDKEFQRAENHDDMPPQIMFAEFQARQQQNSIDLDKLLENAYRDGKMMRAQCNLPPSVIYRMGDGVVDRTGNDRVNLATYSILRRLGCEVKTLFSNHAGFLIEAVKFFVDRMREEKAAKSRQEMDLIDQTAIREQLLTIYREAPENLGVDRDQITTDEYVPYFIDRMERMVAMTPTVSPVFVLFDILHTIQIAREDQSYIDSDPNVLATLSPALSACQGLLKNKYSLPPKSAECWHYPSFMGWLAAVLPNDQENDVQYHQGDTHITVSSRSESVQFSLADAESQQRATRRYQSFRADLEFDITDDSGFYLPGFKSRLEREMNTSYQAWVASLCFIDRPRINGAVLSHAPLYMRQEEKELELAESEQINRSLRADLAARTRVILPKLAALRDINLKDLKDLERASQNDASKLPTLLAKLRLRAAELNVKSKRFEARVAALNALANQLNEKLQAYDNEVDFAFSRNQHANLLTRIQKLEEKLPDLDLRVCDRSIEMAEQESHIEEAARLHALLSSFSSETETHGGLMIQRWIKAYNECFRFMISIHRFDARSLSDRQIRELQNSDPTTLFLYEMDSAYQAGDGELTRDDMADVGALSDKNPWRAVEGYVNAASAWPRSKEVTLKRDEAGKLVARPNPAMRRQRGDKTWLMRRYPDGMNPHGHEGEIGEGSIDSQSGKPASLSSRKGSGEGPAGKKKDPLNAPGELAFEKLVAVVPRPARFGVEHIDIKLLKKIDDDPSDRILYAWLKRRFVECMNAEPVRSPRRESQGTDELRAVEEGQLLPGHKRLSELLEECADKIASRFGRTRDMEVSPAGEVDQFLRRVLGSEAASHELKALICLVQERKQSADRALKRARLVFHQNAHLQSVGLRAASVRGHLIEQVFVTLSEHTLAADHPACAKLYAETPSLPLSWGISFHDNQIVQAVRKKLTSMPRTAMVQSNHTQVQMVFSGIAVLSSTALGIVYVRELAYYFLVTQGQILSMEKVIGYPACWLGICAVIWALMLTVRVVKPTDQEARFMRWVRGIIPLAGLSESLTMNFFLRPMLGLFSVYFFSLWDTDVDLALNLTASLGGTTVMPQLMTSLPQGNNTVTPARMLINVYQDLWPYMGVAAVLGLVQSMVAAWLKYLDPSIDMTLGMRLYSVFFDGFEQECRLTSRQQRVLAVWRQVDQHVFANLFIFSSLCCFLKFFTIVTVPSEMVKISFFSAFAFAFVRGSVRLLKMVSTLSHLESKNKTSIKKGALGISKALVIASNISILPFDFDYLSVFYSALIYSSTGVGEFQTMSGDLVSILFWVFVVVMTINKFSDQVVANADFAGIQTDDHRSCRFLHFSKQSSTHERRIERQTWKTVGSSNMLHRNRIPTSHTTIAVSTSDGSNGAGDEVALL